MSLLPPSLKSENDSLKPSHLPGAHSFISFKICLTFFVLADQYSENRFFPSACTNEWCLVQPKNWGRGRLNNPKYQVIRSQELKVPETGIIQTSYHTLTLRQTTNITIEFNLYKDKKEYYLVLYIRS